MVSIFRLLHFTLARPVSQNLALLQFIKFFQLNYMVSLSFLAYFLAYLLSDFAFFFDLVLIFSVFFLLFTFTSSYKFFSLFIALFYLNAC